MAVVISYFTFLNTYKSSKKGKVINDAYGYSYQMDSKISEMKSFLQNGDIIFQTSTSTQSTAIQKVTNSKYSHMGIIYKEGDNFYVFEASKKVTRTNLRNWVERGENSDCVIKRVKNSKNILSKDNLIKMKKVGVTFLGKPYDSHFGWSNDKMYCSELVWKVYKQALDLELCKLRKPAHFELDKPEIRDIIKKSFQGRRKMIKNTLKTSYKNIIELMAISDIPENSRPENITLQQFCHLTDAIDKSRT